MNGGHGDTGSMSAAGPLSSRLLQPERCAFFLDLDGTLLEIAQTPAAVRVDAQLLVLIADLHGAARGALALISGRPIADIDRLLDMAHLPAAGQHGAERRDARGRVHVHSVDEQGLAALRAQIASWRDSYAGLVVEDKGQSIALHYRAAPALEATLDRLAHAAIRDMVESFQIQRGKMVLEIKPSGRDKGKAIEEFLGEPPFAGRVPVFIGDDVTDEYGFDAVNARGGVSIKVGDGPTVACWSLQSVDAVHRWLRQVLANADREARG